MSGKKVEVCQVCEKKKDLRYGVCFSCADFVKSDGLTAYDVRKPSRRWMVNREPCRTWALRVKRT